MLATLCALSLADGDYEQAADLGVAAERLLEVPGSELFRDRVVLNTRLARLHISADPMLARQEVWRHSRAPRHCGEGMTSEPSHVVGGASSIWRT